MIRPAVALRGLAQRGGSTLMIAAVALVATAAAAAGPVYYQAARTSILRDTLAAASIPGRGYEANETGALPGLLNQLTGAVSSQLSRDLAALHGRGLFAPAIDSIETTLPYPAEQTSIPLVWRTGVCGQLRVRGGCPVAANQVMVSTRLDAVTHWSVGQRISFPGWRPLTITGIYRLPNPNRAYWFGRGSLYFSVGRGSVFAQNSAIDAMFTPRATLELGPPGAAGHRGHRRPAQHRPGDR